MQPKTRSILIWIGSALLAIAFVMAGATKLMAQDPHPANFENWGYPSWFMYVVGAWELAAGIAVLVPKLRFYAAAFLVGNMVGAAITHVTAAEYAMLIPNVILGSIAGLIAWAERPAWVLAMGQKGEAAQHD